MGLRTSHNAKLPSYTDPQNEIDSLREILKATIGDLVKTQDALNAAQDLVTYLEQELIKYKKQPVNMSEL